MGRPVRKAYKEADGYVDFYAEEEIYKKETGDRHWYVGFDRRFAEWRDKNPRKGLVLSRED